MKTYTLLRYSCYVFHVHALLHTHTHTHKHYTHTHNHTHRDNCPAILLAFRVRSPHHIRPHWDIWNSRVLPDHPHKGRMKPLNNAWSGWTLISPSATPFPCYLALPQGMPLAHTPCGPVHSRSEPGAQTVIQDFLLQITISILKGCFEYAFVDPTGTNYYFCRQFGLFVDYFVFTVTHITYSVHPIFYRTPLYTTLMQHCFTFATFCITLTFSPSPISCATPTLVS